MIKQVRS